MRIYNDQKNRYGDFKPELEFRMDTIVLEKGKDS